MMLRLLPALLAICIAGTCGAETPPAGFHAAATSALASFPSAGLAVVRIEDGAIVWSGYAGEQAPGIPASASTLFNTASLAKTVTAELTLRLASDGALRLDEAIASEYVHPDLVGDPRFAQLTPELLLSHQSGFRNWPYDYEDGRLAFVQPPGTGFTYSGIGYEILAEFVARRRGTDFPDLVEARIIAPEGLQGQLFLGAANAPPDHLVMPMRRDGQYTPLSPAELLPSAADNLFVTAPAYAKLLIAMMEDTPLDGALAGARKTSILDTSAHAPCQMQDPGYCPVAAGQSLGWSIATFPEATYVFHTGSDRGENAIAIYDVTHHDGWVLFVNGGNGLGVWLQLMETLAPYDAYFRFIRTLPQVRAKLAATSAKER